MTTGKSIIKNFKKDKGFEIIPRELLQHCDKKAKDKNGKEHGKNGLSLQAIGLLVNLQSYPEDWELHKTELYTRYSKNGKTSVMSAWDELVEKKYIIQFHKRVGKANQYIYYYNLTPFTDEEIKEVERLESLKSKESLSFSKSEAQNQKLKMGSSKSATNKEHSKENTQKYSTEETNGHSEVSGKTNHESHEIHSSNDYEKDYYVDELPKILRTTLKQYEIEEIKIFKNLFRRALNEVNQYDNIYDLSIEEVAYQIDKVLHKINVKRKIDFNETGIYESIQDLKGFIYTSFRNAFFEYVESNDAYRTSIDAPVEPSNNNEGETSKKENQGNKTPVFAGEVEEIRELIENFRNS